MMDLPNHSVLIGGLDSWSTGGDEIIEPRLVDKLKSLFDPPLQVLKLYQPAARPRRSRPRRKPASRPGSSLNGSSRRTSTARQVTEPSEPECWCIARC